MKRKVCCQSSTYKPSKAGYQVRLPGAAARQPVAAEQRRPARQQHPEKMGKILAFTSLAGQFAVFCYLN